MDEGACRYVCAGNLSSFANFLIFWEGKESSAKTPRGGDRRRDFFSGGTTAAVRMRVGVPKNMAAFYPVWYWARGLTPISLTDGLKWG
jgi:hypothetical protein